MFIFGTSSHSYAQQSKEQSQKKSSTIQVKKKSISKKKGTVSKKKASVKKKSSKKKRSAAKKSTTVSRSKKTTAVKNPARTNLVSVNSAGRTVAVNDTSYINPDDLPALEDDAEDLPEETQKIKVSELLEKYIATNQNSQPTDSINQKEKIIMEIIKYLDTPYKFGGNTSKGIDCSAFTKTIYSNTFFMELPRTAREQYQLGEVISEKTELKFGDLVFFNTRRRVRPGHVGIYIGDNLFAHSSSKQGVMVSSLESEFYSKRFMGARRVEKVLSH